MTTEPAAVKVYRFKLTIAYDGTAYAGWQVQPNALTVQEVVEKALERLTGLRPKIHGSGRTDQGVHARGQVAHVDLAVPFKPAGLLKGLNALLPEDIRVLRASRAAPDFHARRHATGKEYRYFIWTGKTVPPFIRLYRAQVTGPLDLEAMNAAARVFVGKWDFAAFSANPNREIETHVREITELKAVRRGQEIVIIAKGEGFLYKMVRSLAGFLIRVGKGELQPGVAHEILASRTRTARVPTAPAKGLFLWKVTY